MAGWLGSVKPEAAVLGVELVPKDMIFELLKVFTMVTGGTTAYRLIYNSEKSENEN